MTRCFGKPYIAGDHRVVELFAKMGLELFGPGAVAYFAVACAGSYVFSTHHSIYAMERDNAAEQPSWLARAIDLTNPSQRTRAKP